MTPAIAKNAIGCHFPWSRLRAAKAATMTHPLANFLTRAANAQVSERPKVRPTATEASAPRTAATYSHSSVADIIEKIKTRAMA